MSYSPESFESEFLSPRAETATRATFLRKVYTHVFASLLVMTGLVALFVNLFDAGMIQMIGQGWIAILFAFMAVSWIAQRMAQSRSSIGTQYAGLGLYTLAEAVILTPLVWIAWNAFGEVGHQAVFQAAILTLLVFGGLTAVVFFTGANFSFLRGFLTIAMILAFGAILFASWQGIDLGMWFAIAMVGLMAMTILYQTSEIRDEFPDDMYVAAALWLVSSIATLFWYILRILLMFASDD